MNTVKYHHILLLPPANEVWSKVIFLHLSVILFTGGSASVHDGIPQPPRPGTPWTRDCSPPSDTPQTRHPLGQTPPGSDTPWSRHPHPEADTPQTRHPPHTPLRSACWEIRSTSGRYASHWNAILF